MKTSEVSYLQSNISQFDELCTSFDRIGKGLTSNPSHTEAVGELTLANECLSKLRGELETTKYEFPRVVGKLVANDYFAMMQLAANVDCINAAVDERGRISALVFHNIQSKIDEIALLSELNALTVIPITAGYGNVNLSPLVDCPKLTILNFFEVHSGMKKLESVLNDLPWLRSVEVNGYQLMDLSWANSHRELTKLCVTGLAIEELSPLANCVNLRSLEIAQNPIRSLAPLRDLTLLRELDIREVHIRDLWDLCDMPSLFDLKITPSMTLLPGYAECKELIELRGGKVNIMS